MPWDTENHTRFFRCSAKMWQDEAFASLDPTAKLLYIYIHSAVLGNAGAGLFNPKDERHAKVLSGARTRQLSARNLLERFKKLCKIGLVRYESAQFLVWSPRWFRYHPPRFRNAPMSVSNAIAELPPGEFRDEIITVSLEMIRESAKPNDLNKPIDYARACAKLYSKVTSKVSGKGSFLSGSESESKTISLRELETVSREASVGLGVEREGFSEGGSESEGGSVGHGASDPPEVGVGRWWSAMVGFVRCARLYGEVVRAVPASAMQSAAEVWRDLGLEQHAGEVHVAIAAEGDARLRKREDPGAWFIEPPDASFAVWLRERRWVPQAAHRLVPTGRGGNGVRERRGEDHAPVQRPKYRDPTPEEVEQMERWRAEFVAGDASAGERLQAKLRELQQVGGA